MPRPIRARDAIAFSLFALGWLVPIAYSGLVHAPIPGIGRYLNDQVRVGCLFIIAPLTWESYHVEYREIGGETWIEPPRDEVSTMQPFGHATRFEMLLGRSTVEQRGVVQRQRMAEFVGRRLAELHPEAPAIDAVRFSLVYDIVRSYDRVESAKAKAWAWKPLDECDPAHVEVISTHFFDGRAPVDGRTGPVTADAYEASGSCFVSRKANGQQP